MAVSLKLMQHAVLLPKSWTKPPFRSIGILANYCLKKVLLKDMAVVLSKNFRPTSKPSFQTWGFLHETCGTWKSFMNTINLLICSFDHCWRELLNCSKLSWLGWGRAPICSSSSSVCLHRGRQVPIQDALYDQYKGKQYMDLNQEVSIYL